MTHEQIKQRNCNLVLDICKKLSEKGFEITAPNVQRSLKRYGERMQVKTISMYLKQLTNEGTLNCIKTGIPTIYELVEKE